MGESKRKVFFMEPKYNNIVRTSDLFYELNLATTTHDLFLGDEKTIFTNLNDTIDSIFSIENKILRSPPDGDGEYENQFDRIINYYDLYQKQKIRYSLIKSEWIKSKEPDNRRFLLSMMEKIDISLDDFRRNLNLFPFDLNTNCHLFSKVNLGLMFGKSDLCIFNQVPHPYWANRIRMRLHGVKSIREIFPIPAQRVLDNKIIQQLFDMELSEIINPTNYRNMWWEKDVLFDKDDCIFFTLIRLQNEQKNPSRLPRVSGKNVEETIYRLMDMKNNQLMKIDGFHSEKMDVFLTFSENRILIKFGIDKKYCSNIYKILLTLFDYIDAPYDSSTHMCLPVTDKLDIVEWKTNEDFCCVDSMPVGILVNVHANHNEFIKEVKDKLNSDKYSWIETIETGEQFTSYPKLYQRIGYWDLFIGLRTYNIKRLAYNVITDILSHENVRETRVIPMEKI